MVARNRNNCRDQPGRFSLSGFEDDTSPIAEAVRQELTAHLVSQRTDGNGGGAIRSAHGEFHRRAIQAARREVLAMRQNNDIGDDAFHEIEEELDWLEMADGTQGP